MAIKAIARKLGLDRKTVRKYAHAETADALIGPTASDGRDVLRPFKDYLHARIRDGVTDTPALAEQIRARGYRGSDRTLRRWLSQARRAEPAQPQPEPIPSARTITSWIMRPVENLDPTERDHLAELTTQCADLARITDCARDSPPWYATAPVRTCRTGSMRPSPPPSQNCAASPTASTGTSTRSATDSHCPGAPDRWKATSTA